MLKVRFFNKQALHSIYISIIFEYKSNISNERQADEVKMMNIILYTNKHKTVNMNEWLLDRIINHKK